MKMVRGQGMPSPRHHNFGNLYISFQVKFPEKNWTQDPAHFDSLRQILPAPSLQNIPPQDAMTEPVDLEEVDNGGKTGGFSGAAMDDDEDDRPHGGERVQCASQ
jgi:DnaJ family protein A protein 2